MRRRTTTTPSPIHALRRHQCPAHSTLPEGARLGDRPVAVSVTKVGDCRVGAACGAVTARGLALICDLGTHGSHWVSLNDLRHVSGVDELVGATWTTATVVGVWTIVSPKGRHLIRQPLCLNWRHESSSPFHHWWKGHPRGLAPDDYPYNCGCREPKKPLSTAP